MPNSREWALLIWMLVLLAWAIRTPSIRSSLASVLRAGANPKILFPLLVMIGWVGFLAWCARQCVPPNIKLAKGVVVWLLTAGVVMFFKFDSALKNAHYIRSTITSAIAWPALMSFYLGLFTLHLFAELLLQPVLALLAAMSVVAARDEKYRAAGVLVETLLSLAGIVLLVFVTLNVMEEWQRITKADTLVQFALPVWLTVGSLPFILSLAVYSAYEQAFVRLNFIENLPKGRRLRTKLAVALGLRLRAQEVSTLPLHRLSRVAEAYSFGGAYDAVREYRRSRNEEARQEVEKVKRMKRLAGVGGVDSDGRRLDRREFEETTDALRWIHTCMARWYDKSGRYRDDILTIQDGSFDGYGLHPIGIEMHVSSDGQAWYAWRRTVTGWCFAIGASGAPPNQWECDGPQPPDGFPDIDPSWGSSPFSEGANPNW